MAEKSKYGLCKLAGTYSNCVRCGMWRPTGHPCIRCMERGTDLTPLERQYRKGASGIWYRVVRDVSAADTVTASKDGSSGG